MFQVNISYKEQTKENIWNILWNYQDKKDGEIL
jgi:hypothetical protein